MAIEGAPPPVAAVIGAGPAGLMAAEVLASGGVAVTVYDHMPSAGRKLLMAGRGGLNLTHSEDSDRFRARYRMATPKLTTALDAFGPDDLRAWSQTLGQTTFVGTSGRVFPQAMKASPLLRAWLNRLQESGVTIRLRHSWTGWNDASELTFDTPDSGLAVRPDVTVLALGGASWPRLGSDGRWTSILQRAGVALTPLQPSNCGFRVEWSELFRERFSGQPLKRIALTLADDHVRGEATITAQGIEGGAIYALSAPLREVIARGGTATISLSLRPDLSVNALRQRLEAVPAKQSLANRLRKALRLPPVAIGLLHEAALARGQRLADLSTDALADLICAVPLRLVGTAPLADAISTAGGIAWDALDEHLMLLRQPGVFAAGEMLDWEAPTGGYLLQATFATGRLAGRGALSWLERQGRLSR